MSDHEARRPTFRERLRNREPLLGTLVTLPLPQIPEILALAGFDWFFIDGEHASLSASDIQMLVQAASPHGAALVRVADEGPAIKSALDSGANGIIAPLVQTAAQAEAIVQAARYPPAGQRSMGVGRAQGYGLRFHDYLDRANAETVVVIQVEHISAVEQIEAIAQVEGLDGIFLGPYDLSASMGKPGAVHDLDVREAIEKVRRVSLEAGLPLGIFGLEPEGLASYQRQGFSLLALGLDTGFLGQAATAARTALAQSIEDSR